MSADWLIPDWPAPERVQAVFTTREGGVSKLPYDSLNLGDHVGDASDDVQTNRLFLQRRIEAKPVFMTQVHGQNVLRLAGNTLGMTGAHVADGCMTSEPGLACTVMVADCLPVLFAHEHAGVVAAAHAGWRGLAGQAKNNGILEATFEQFARAVRQAENSRTESDEQDEGVAASTLVWLGPCIGPAAFEVGEDVKTAFEAMQPEAASLFVAQAAGKYLADLAGLAHLRLRALGITKIFGNDGSAAWCTVNDSARFFSHRRDARQAGSTGRMAACIWLS